LWHPSDEHWRRTYNQSMATPSGIPPFRPDGYLPIGIHLATEVEVTFRFGTPSRRRHRLMLRLRRWIELGRAVGAQRLLLDGSFVTAKMEPNDIDAVLLIPENFGDLVAQGMQSAVELEEMFLTRHPEELFPAEDEAVWLGWCEFFSWTRETDQRRKGLVEIVL
jgi:hypothetical protein